MNGLNRINLPIAQERKKATGTYSQEFSQAAGNCDSKLEPPHGSAAENQEFNFSTSK
jgi:hypothetical protein